MRRNYPKRSLAYWRQLPRRYPVTSAAVVGGLAGLAGGGLT